MLQKKEDIEKIAREILEKIDFDYEKDQDFTAKIVDENDGRFKKNTWMVHFLWGVEEFGKGRSAFLFIDNETGNPVYMQYDINLLVRFEVNDKGEIIVK